MMDNEHILEREYSGRGAMRTITPICSCGWRGDGVPAWNDYQHHMAKLQESAHSRQALESHAGAVCEAQQDQE